MTALEQAFPVIGDLLQLEDGTRAQVVELPVFELDVFSCAELQRERICSTEVCGRIAVGSTAEENMYLQPEDRVEYMKALVTTKPDKEIVPYLDRLNAIEGVCTVTSCCGWHAWQLGGEITTGFVTLHLNEERARLLETTANNLPQFCNGFVHGLYKEWLHYTSRPIVWHTVHFNGSVFDRALEALVALLTGP